jgi:hypothetical protein
MIDGKSWLFFFLLSWWPTMLDFSNTSRYASSDNFPDLFKWLAYLILLLVSKLVFFSQIGKSLHVSKTLDNKLHSIPARWFTKIYWLFCSFDHPFRINKNAKNRGSFTAAQDLLQWNYHVFLEWKKMKLRGWRCFGFFHWVNCLLKDSTGYLCFFINFLAH